MPGDLWVNLPVADPARSKEFYRRIGFSFHGRDMGDGFALEFGEKGSLVMFFPQSTFSSFTGAEPADTAEHSEVLLSVAAGSRQEVDDIIAKVENAGGTVFGRPSEREGWMYGAGFSDPDGHRWNLLYMDESRMRGS